jgi:phage/plasmid-like protein (TIGR03299 family)
MPAEVEAVAFNTERGTPWHGIGTPINGLFSAEEAVSKGGLDWLVEQHDMVTVSGKPIPDKVAQIRSTDGAYLGCVGKGSFSTVQNRDAFGLANAIVAEEPDRALYDTAGSLKGGRVVFMSMDLTAVAPINVLNDNFRTFLLIANGHDGLMALHAAITPVRSVCVNTVNMAIAGASARIAIRHTGSIESKLAAARSALGLSIDYAKRFEEVAAAAAAVNVTDAEAQAILQRVFRMDPDTLARGEGAVYDHHASNGAFERYQTSEDLAAFRGTGWGLVNAVAEYVDHDRSYGKEMNRQALDRRMTSIVWGAGQEAVSYTMALVAPTLVPAKVLSRANALPVPSKR